MTHQPDPPAAVAISRREAIQRAALLAGVALSPAWLHAGERIRQAAPAKISFTPAQAATVRAVADRILPRTDTPGAVDVGVPAFIDRFHAEFMTPAEQQLVMKGLSEVEAAAKAAGGASFATLPGPRQDEVLRGLARAQEEQAESAFRLMRAVTVLGYFTSVEVGRNVLHYDPVPGGYQPCVPIEEVGRRNWTL
jgi:hypothetical protein